MSCREKTRKSLSSWARPQRDTIPVKPANHGVLIKTILDFAFLRARTDGWNVGRLDKKDVQSQGADLRVQKVEKPTS